MFTNGSLGRLSGNFESVRDELMVNNDQEFVLRDFAPYVQAWTELGEEYGDAQLWARKSLHNIASSGFFSSDRTIREYASEIWDA